VLGAPQAQRTVVVRIHTRMGPKYVPRAGGTGSAGIRRVLLRR
jgi:hypothetical protein